MVERVLFGNLSAVTLISLSYHLRRPLDWHPAHRFSASSTPYLLPASSLRNSWVYRDALGYVNQCLAQAADHVYLMVTGLAVDIKRLHEETSL